MDLSLAPQHSPGEALVRLDAVAHLDESLRALTSSDAELGEVSADLGVIDDPYGSIADRRFRRHGSSFLDGRYNKKAFPGFYVAEDEQTSMQEVLHGKVKSLTDINTPVFLEFTRWSISGVGRDISAQTRAYPQLLSNDWSFCQDVGEQAIGQQEDLLRVASVRRSGGINVVAFLRNRVRSLGGRAGRVQIDKDAQSNLTIRRV